MKLSLFNGNAKKPDGFMQGRTKLTLALLVLVLGGVAVGVAMLASSSSKPVEYTVANGSLQIKCTYGDTVALNDITGLELVQGRPDIAERTWGSAIGEKLRGGFALSGGKAAKVFFENATPPFIHFTVGDTQYYMNGMTPDDTNRLFGELQSAQKQ